MAERHDLDAGNPKVVAGFEVIFPDDVRYDEGCQLLFETTAARSKKFLAESNEAGDGCAAVINIAVFGSRLSVINPRLTA
jgi:hypothetical protein